MRITVEVRDIYGNRVIYPLCEAARLFAQIAGTKTLTQQSIKCIKALGYSIDVKQQEVTL